MQTVPKPAAAISSNSKKQQRAPREIPIKIETNPNKIKFNGVRFATFPQHGQTRTKYKTKKPVQPKGINQIPSPDVTYSLFARLNMVFFTQSYFNGVGQNENGNEDGCDGEHNRE